MDQNSFTGDVYAMLNENKKQRSSSLIVIILLLLGAIGYNMITGGGISLDMDDKAVAVVGEAGTVFVLFEDISDIELVRELDIGEKTGDDYDGKLSQGKYKNSAFGEYELYISAEAPPYVVIRHANGVLVVNERNESATTAFLDKLTAAVEAYRAA